VRIVRLPADLANQIAAGEVVERPASAVKELVENAIDASARRISVAVDLGGKRLIRVDDDGEGMAPEDALLAVERHATSKIASADDLGRITTLGFRGEALPSIASVSHFTLRTRARGAPLGTEVRIEGGGQPAVRDVGMPEGTSVEVADLFYNLPARRKFLKSDTAETTQVSRVVAQLALCYPEVGFTLTSGSRRLLQCPPVADLRARLHQLYGERPDLVEVTRGGDISLRGYVAALADQGPVRGPQHVFVNRRIVRDRTIAHAINEAYSAASIRERSPEVHLFIEMPPDALDVNVHPTKAEVRFREQSHVHEVVRRTLMAALGQGPVPDLRLSAPVAPHEPIAVPLPVGYSGVLPSRWAGRDAGAVPGSASMPRPSGGIAVDAPQPDGARAAPQEPGASLYRALMLLGQFRDTYIVAVDEEGIAIIDQHVAHERVLFERILERLSGQRLESQRRLHPLVLELSPAGQQALVSHRGELERLGFEVEEFGPGVVRVSAVPALLTAGDAETAVRALAEDLEGLDRGSTVDEALRRIAATMACHAAVKAHDRLTPEKMAHILSELRQTAYSTVCPHGRPVMLRLSRREIEKNFQRI